MKTAKATSLAELGVLAAQGFQAGAAACGLKRPSRRGGKPLDLALIAADRPANVAALFTTNRFAAAPVSWSRQVADRGMARAVVVNAGNANACTGQAGLRAARKTAEVAARQLGAGPREIMVASTGIIGRPLPVSRVERGIVSACKRLSTGRTAAKATARAIMTTDTVPKVFAVEGVVGGRTVRVGGIAKGSGMIAPNLATMLCFMTTDAAIDTGPLRTALRRAAARSFNRITVDGDTSTNDTVLVLASGAAGNRRIKSVRSKAYHEFEALVREVALALAHMIVRDGEGATKFIEVTVRGAASERDAEHAARAIASSPLVKTAIYGGDPNWGRIVCALGYSGAAFNPDSVTVRICGLPVFARGAPRRAARLSDALKSKDLQIAADLGNGDHQYTVWTCDFSHEYVTINAEYHT